MGVNLANGTARATVFEAATQSNGKLIISHTGSSDETLTQRIVKDAVVRPTTDTSAEVNKFLKKTSTGTVWAEVTGGGEPEAYIKDAAVANNTLTLTKKDGTTTVDVTAATLNAQEIISDLVTIRSGASAGATAVQPADMTTALAAKLSDNTADYSSSSAYAVGAFCKYNGALYVCKVAIASGGEAWNAEHWTAMPNVSSLFSGANTSYAGTAMPISAGVISASNPSIKDYVDAQVGTIETALSEV